MAVRSCARRSTAPINIGRPPTSDRYLLISVRRLRHAGTGVAAKLRRSPLWQIPCRVGGGPIWRHLSLPCPRPAVAHVIATTAHLVPIRPPGRHLIAPVDRSQAATSPDDVLLTSSIPDPHADVMLTSFQKRANKAKRPYFYGFSRFFLLFSVKKTSVLSACKLRPAVYQPTFNHPQKLRAPTQLLFRSELLVKQVFARPFPCKLVFHGYL